MVRRLKPTVTRSAVPTALGFDTSLWIGTAMVKIRKSIMGAKDIWYQESACTFDSSVGASDIVAMGFNP